jgi:hydroxymethylglutaryl-CoA lyase
MFEGVGGEVRVVEVGLRDGLQNLGRVVETARKFELVVKLVEAGCREIELTSFVSPKVVPQFVDAEDLVRMVLGNSLFDHVTFTCLVPNLHGIERAHRVGVNNIAIFIAASESFAQANTNASIDVSIQRASQVFNFANAHNIRARAYLSTVFGCPYGEIVTRQRVVELTKRLLDLGAYEVAMGDTTGIANPLSVDQLLKDLIAANIDLKKIAFHFHDTHGFALLNVLVALLYGISTFDGSIGGLGGCPFAPGAPGNVDTRSLIKLFDAMNIQTGISLEKLALISLNHLT